MDAPRICSVEECGKPVLARGWCTAHYCKWQRHGSPTHISSREPPIITQDYLKEILDYDPESGVFVWKYRHDKFNTIKVWNATFHGKEAGRVMKRKVPYRQIKINSKLYYAHRLAWLYMTGDWPEGYVDHVNTDGLDNRWSNLREATNAQNQQNVGRNSANTVGLKGVCFAKSTQKYQASIKHNGKLIYLGQYTTPEEAHAVYCEAAQRLHGEFANVGNGDGNATE